MGRTALVTGGASGLGGATAATFAAAGIRVFVADINGAAAGRVAAELPGSGHRGFALNVADEAQVEKVFGQIENECGPIDILAHFAGVSGYAPDGGRVQIADETIDNWNRTIDVNLKGTFLCIREMLRCRRKLAVPHGRIITTSSMVAQSGGVNGGGAYAASKGAVLSLSKMAALEAASMGITVNCIAPCAIDTPMLRSVMPRERDAAYAQAIPMGRIGTPQDIAAAALYLASEAASFVTGSCIDVNGGMRMQ
jgi:3-oxoacyl-[acyl-carrier protein] reductase